MYLDTTILQSRTTDTLIEFIDELMESRISKGDPHLEVNKKYQEIKRQQRKAKKLEEKDVSI